MNEMTLRDFFNQYWVNPYNKCVIKNYNSELVDFELDTIVNIKKEYDAILDDYIIYSVYVTTYSDEHGIYSGCYEILTRYYDE